MTDVRKQAEEVVQKMVSYVLDNENDFQILSIIRELDALWHDGPERFMEDVGTHKKIPYKKIIRDDSEYILNLLRKMLMEEYQKEDYSFMQYARILVVMDYEGLCEAEKKTSSVRFSIANDFEQEKKNLKRRLALDFVRAYRVYEAENWIYFDAEGAKDFMKILKQINKSLV